MPQSKPISWINMLIITNMIILIMLIKLNFNTKNKTKNKLYNKTNMNNMKW